jgi:pimeloyl-ACP methyl ester carboxylesterase
LAEDARFGSVPPPAHAPGEDHAFVLAEDETRLFMRTRRGSHAPDACHVFFCDGILCDGFIWKYLWDDLAPHYPLVHWHYRGHGRSASPKDESRIDIAAHAADLMAVRKHAGDPPCVLVGHSMGTQVCLEAYHRYPDRVRGIVLVCGSFGKVTQSFRGMPILDLILPKLMDIVEKQPDIARAIWTRIPPEMALKLALRSRDVDPDKVHAEDMLPYLHHMTHVDFPMFLRMLRAAGDHSAESYLADVKVPVLIIAGEKDTFTPASLSNFMGETMPYAELLMVAGGTHVAPIEQPELVKERLLSFLERVLPPDEIPKAPL